MRYTRPICRHILRSRRTQLCIQRRLQSQSAQSSQPSAIQDEHPLITQARLHPEDFQPLRPPSKEPPKSFHPAFVGVVAGSMTTLAACLAWYYYSGAAQVAKTAKDGHRYLHERRGTIEQKSVGTSTATRAVTTAREGKGVRLVGDGAQELEMEAKTKWLRAAARNYGQYIPSTVAWIDVAFDELDDVRAAGGKNRQEVDRAVRECYDDMEVFGQRALGKDDAREAWVLLGTYLRRVHEIAEKERERGKEKAAVNTDEPSRKGRWWIVK